MSNYRVRASRHTHPRLGGEGLTDQAFAWLIPDAAVVELSEEGATAIVELSLERESHLEALNEIFGALQRLGYSVLASSVSEWVDLALQTSISSALAVGAGTQAVSKDPRITAVASVLAAIGGHWVGSRLGRMEVVFELAPTPTGWTLEPVTKAASAPTPALVS